MRTKSTVLGLALFLTLVIGALPAFQEKTLPPVLENPGRAVYAGVRSSAYGIKPFPEPADWQTAMTRMTGHFPGSVPCAIWIVGELRRPRGCHLYFPGDGTSYPNVEFDAVDKHEPFLSFFDRAGIKVFLQVEPAHADMISLIDLVLGRYKHHSCVIGFGVDVEWYKEADNPQWGVPVDDATAKLWEERVRSHNSAYRLFLKHWDRRWMPETYRGDIVFVDDSQEFDAFEDMITEFASEWASTFYPNLVFFQVGYRSDQPWWSKLAIPPRDIGEAIRQRVRQDCGIFWVDFSLRDVLLTGGR